jgi:hypothetical protein
VSSATMRGILGRRTGGTLQDFFGVSSTEKALKTSLRSFAKFFWR